MYESKTCKKSIILLTGLLLVSCLFIFRAFLFGNQLLAFTDIGSDTYDQYLMHYQTIINHLQEGSFSLWDFNNGFGINMFSLNMFDPFLLLLYLFGTLFGVDKIYGMLIFLQILRIVLAGLSLYGFLSCFALSEKSKLLSAYAYGLCGYMIVWGQHYQFGNVVIWLPLLLMAAEKAYKKTIWLLGLTLLCCVCSISSLYFAYMQFLVLGFYLLFRTAWRGRLFCAEGLKKVGKAYGSMILGIGMGMFSLLPSAMMLLNVSGRVGGDSIVTKILREIRPYERAYYVTLMKRFFSSNLQGINAYSGYSNYYEDSNVFLSVLFLFALVQFVFLFFRRKYTVKQRILLAAAFGVGGILLLLPVGSLVFNGFSYPFSRHTFVCLPFFAWMMADVLQEILENQRLCLPLLLVSMFAVVCEYVRIYLGHKGSLALCLGILAFFMAGFLAGSARFRSHRMRTVSTAGLAVTLILTMSVDAYYSYNCQRAILEKAPSEYFDRLYEPSVKEALSELSRMDTSFYRVEKDYTIGTEISCLNSLAQNYSGVSTYNSTLNTGTAEFLQNFWPSLQVENETHHSFANAVNDDFQASLCHVKYVLSDKADFQVQGYEFYRQFGDIYVYRNTNTQELGKFYQTVFTTKAYESSSVSLDKEALLAENVLCDTIPALTRSSDEISIYQKRIEAQEEQIVQELQDESVILLKFPQLTGNAQEKYLLEFELSFPETIGKLKAEVGAHTTHLTAGATPIHVELSVPGNVREVRLIQAGIPSAEQAVITNKRLSRCKVRNLSDLSQGIHFEAVEKDSIVEGTARVSDQGILMLSIPYENGWHAYVDGEETEIHQVNYGFSGIYLEAGDHRIQMVYRCPGFSSGVLCSLFFSLLVIGIWWRRRNVKD